MRKGAGTGCRQRPSRWLIARILKAQDGACRACGCRLEHFEMDHVVALGLGGANSPDNWAALCPPCHRSKTRADLQRMAKADRQRRFMETGRGRARTRWRPFDNSPGDASGGCFDRSLRRHLNGVVSRRCHCPVCRGRERE